jgi:hypothetical protein
MRIMHYMYLCMQCICTSHSAILFEGHAHAHMCIHTHAHTCTRTHTTRTHRFQDHLEYKGRQVCFYKRAQILAGDIWGAFKGKGLGAMHDVVCIWINTRTHIHTHTFTITCVCVRARARTCVLVCVYVCMCRRSSQCLQTTACPRYWRRAAYSSTGNNKKSQKCALWWLSLVKPKRFAS